VEEKADPVVEREKRREEKRREEKVSIRVVGPQNQEITKYQNT